MKRILGDLPIVALLGALTLSCGKSSTPVPGDVPSVPVASIPGHAQRQDTTHKEGPRLLSAETFIRSYMSVFGALAPLELQAKLQGTDGAGVFDSWRDYLAALGMPDYANEVSRSTQTNALMIATFERTGVALCDRAVQSDLVAAPSIDKRAVFAFDLPKTGDVDAAGFATRFDVLHRTFLGLPASLAPSDRTTKFYALYQGTVSRHTATGAPASKFTPQQAGWATVCYGLVRHPEFHLY